MIQTDRQTDRQKDNKPYLSLVVPCYNEQEVLSIFYTETINEISKFTNSYEFVFVNDGSTDKTLEKIKELVLKDKNVHFVSFSRNFGKEAALYAGLLKAKGKYTTIIDADLQHPPALLPEMVKSLETEDFDAVATYRVNRKNEPPIRSFFAELFYKIMKKLLHNQSPVNGATDFRIMTEKYKNAVLSLKEHNRFSKGIFPWVGFKTKYLPYENVERVAGETKWSFGKLFVYAIDGIIGFSTKPLMFAAWVGILSMFIAFILITFIIIRKFAFGDPVQGWASTISIICFVSGIQLFSLGILGLYTSKIYTEVKNRPLFIIDEEN